jgi:hypothetical protein
MPKEIKFVFILIFLFSYNFAIAGVMNIKKDKFTGYTSREFVSTDKEIAETGVKIRLYLFMGSTITMDVTLIDKKYRPRCGVLWTPTFPGSPILILSKNGEVTKVDTYEDYTAKKCTGYTNIKYLIGGFDLRIPLVNGENLDVYFDTRNMNLKELIID